MRSAVLVWALAFPLTLAVPTIALARQAVAAAVPSLVFEQVTVVDVDQGHLVPDQRVVITGNRIAAVGSAATVSAPMGAQIVDARGKYLIPGLWDMEVGLDPLDVTGPMLIANGVTGIRDWSYNVPADTARRRRQELAAGILVGPPRLVFSGAGLSSNTRPPGGHLHLAVTTPSRARAVVDSLQAAGVDMAFIHGFDSSQAMRKVVFAILAEARRVHLPAVGHLDGGLTLAEASDSGMHSVDHFMGLADICTGKMASLERCAAMAARLQRNDTWMVTGPTLKPARQTRDSMLMWVERAHLPLLYGTDVELSPWLVSLGVLPGFQLHEDLATSVARGLSPLSALRGVTLNPARMLHATDSLGTVAPGKLADLVLLDADPLADITHTKQIRAVVANGRYFDRTALDSLLTEAREKQKRALSKP